MYRIENNLHKKPLKNNKKQDFQRDLLIYLKF